jgi:hypothetical protein
MDIIIIAYPKTLPLLKIFCESYQYHYRGSGDLYIFSDKSCIHEFSRFDLAPGTRVICKEDILPDHLKYSGYLTQQYFKLYAHQIVKSSGYLVMDDDFIFIRPTTEDYFYCNGKPIWFFQKWENAGKAVSWRDPAQRFLGIDQPFCFLTSNPSYLYLSSVVKKLSEFIPLADVLNQEQFAEGQVYGSFAYNRHRSEYVWIDNYWGDEILGGRVNQVAPEYLTLDPTIQFNEFSHFNFLSFWSHWTLAEGKMREFFERSRGVYK